MFSPYLYRRKALNLEYSVSFIYYYLNWLADWSYDFKSTDAHELLAVDMIGQLSVSGDALLLQVRRS
jgi:hypothetical protein